MSLTKKSKLIFSCLLGVLSFIIVAQYALPALADVGPLNPWGNDTVKANIQTITGLGERDPRNIAAQIINVILGFLGIIAVVIILLGGFKWMTAGGNEDKTGEAKKLIVAGVIGLLIIIASFAIASFVLKQLINATNG